MIIQMSTYLKEKNITLKVIDKTLRIFDNGEEMKYKISLHSTSLKQHLITTLMKVIGTKDRDCVKLAAEKEIRVLMEPPTPKETVVTLDVSRPTPSQDNSILLKEFREFREEMRKRDLEIQQLRKEWEEEREEWGGMLAKEKEQMEKTTEKFIDGEKAWREEKDKMTEKFIDGEKAWREERKLYENQVTDLLLEIEELKERTA